jgi:hypothetical protein
MSSASHFEMGDPLGDAFPAEAFQQIGLSHGITITTERLDNLADIFKTNKMTQEIWDSAGKFNDSQNHLEIIPDPDRLEGELTPRNRWGGTESVAFIHFTPNPPLVVDGHLILDPHPKDASRIAHQLIQALQNYFMLVEAGYMEPRDQLVGTTDVWLARVARNYMGFMTYEKVVGGDGQEEEYIRASFETVRDHVFSERIRHFDEALVDRLQ